MNLLVCGGRNFSDEEFVRRELSGLYFLTRVDLLVEGGARGVDTFAREWAEDAKIPVKTFPADWDSFGKKAGIIRNRQMLDYGPRIDMVAAFPGGAGTADMVKAARGRNIFVLELDSEYILRELIG